MLTHLGMYQPVLVEKDVAGQIVDIVRSTTGASLDKSVETAKALFQTISPYVSCDNYRKIAEAVQEYSVDLENCFDAKLLRSLGANLSELFKEKIELSCSVNESDQFLMDCLQMFADCVEKTDPRIPLKIISEGEFLWLKELIDLYQMEQNDEIRLAALKCVNILCACSKDFGIFLLESSLPPCLAQQIDMRDVPYTQLQLVALDTLSRIYSFKMSPPLDHLSYFDRDFFYKLISQIDNNADTILQLMSFFNYTINDDIENPVVGGICQSSVCTFNQHFIKFINKSATEESLQLIESLLKHSGKSTDDLFYDNDLDVLCHILNREYSNSSDHIRSKCRTVVNLLISMGVKNQLLTEVTTGVDQ